ncbi:MAG TPA: hypothetical protein VFC27_03910 [Anaerovoracaceae bacterium]|nr:hypothetical protein [Anaerovoracaceae bacterium]
MEKRLSKHPYFMFTYIFILNITILAMAIIIYLCMRISAANYVTSTFMLFIPIVAAAFVLYNITAHFLELMDLNKSENL